MRLTELDRDMSDVIPTGTSPDSEFLFARMAEVTLASLEARPGHRVLDVASGVGQDDQALAAVGAFAVGAEPSRRMTGLALLRDEQAETRKGAQSCGRVGRVRAWSESLPFASGSFDGAFCKGSLDHFDDPRAAIAEMARVTRRGGRVVLAVANFDSLGCRVLRWQTRARTLGARAARALSGKGGVASGSGAPGRRHYDAPSDHYTRYDPELIREQVGGPLRIESATGVSLLWGVHFWARGLALLGPRAADRVLRVADALARALPGLADVIVVVGQPRASSDS